MSVLASFDPSLPARIRRTRLLGFDFDGVFTDNAVYVFEDGREAVRCYRGDGLGLRRLEQVGVLPVIVSSETNPVVLARSRKLQVRCVHGCTDKLAAVQELAAEQGLTLDQVGFVGNDINDAAVLARVGLAIVVQDAHPDVLSLAHYRTQRPGGYGAVREVCDLFVLITGN
ncbi:MAG: HAD hydrolase family protein [Anaerolineae bacterium]|nr:HAD hydrolase family protein [Caldilineales bacterium]MDW8270784.1 HAD hydrolase family protein [Anaerolineae bacterium]